MAATLDDLLAVLQDQSKRFANIEALQTSVKDALEYKGKGEKYEKEQEVIRKRVAEEERLTKLLKERKISQTT